MESESTLKGTKRKRDHDKAFADASTEREVITAARTEDGHGEADPILNQNSISYNFPRSSLVSLLPIWRATLEGLAPQGAKENIFSCQIRRKTGTGRSEDLTRAELDLEDIEGVAVEGGTVQAQLDDLERKARDYTHVYDNIWERYELCKSTAEAQVRIPGRMSAAKKICR